MTGSWRSACSRASWPVEVFVSTLSVLAGGSGDADVDDGVIDRIQQMTRADGTPVFTTSTSASALVFFVLAMQCLPTLAVTRRETGAWRHAAVQLAYMSSLAYGLAFIVYQSLRAAGVPYVNMLLQDGLVTAVALAALGLLVRRIASVVRPSDGSSCARCVTCATPPTRAAEAIGPSRVIRLAPAGGPASHDEKATSSLPRRTPLDRPRKQR